MVAAMLQPCALAHVFVYGMACLLIYFLIAVIVCPVCNILADSFTSLPCYGPCTASALAMLLMMARSRHVSSKPCNEQEKANAYMYNQEVLGALGQEYRAAASIIVIKQYLNYKQG